MINTILFQKEQYIFSINPGRSGSEYLSVILATAKGVCSKHEPEPKMIGDILRLVENKNYFETYDERVFKAKAINKSLLNSTCSTYVETNHMFVKTFFDVVINELKNTKVVFLKRNIVDTLHSFYQLGYFSKRNKAWRDWMISPYAVTKAIPCFLDEEEKDEIGLSLAYIIDIYARGYRFINEYPDIPVFQITLEDLNQEEKVLELFNKLNIEPTVATVKQIGKRTNSRYNKKKKFGGKEISKEYLKRRCLSYLDKLNSNGYRINNMIVI